MLLPSGGSQSQSTATPTATLSSDILSTFDGSQESAVATLANMDPQHPMYTYISAVAGAPAPPTASSDSAPSSTLAPPTSQASQLSPVHTSPLPPPPMTTPPTTGISQSAPRLPVFAQFQQQSDTNTSTTTTPASQSDSQSSIPMSVIQDARSLSTAASSTNTFSLQPQDRDEATGATPLLPPQATPTPMGEITPANIESLAADVASQVSSFFARTTLPSQEPSTSTLPSTTSLADHLAEELARAVSQLVPTSSGSIFEQPTTSTSTTASTTASGSSLTVQSRHSQPQSMQSPSPSDTLAPLLSSLQMPQGGNGTGTETTSAAGIRTETGVELASSEANIEQETPANFVTVTSGAVVAHPSPAGTAAISFSPSDGEVGVALTQVQSPQPPATIAAPTSSSTTSTSTTCTTEATASNSESRVDGSSSQNAGESSNAQPPAAPPSQSIPSNQQGETAAQAEGQGDGAQATASSEQNQLPEIDPSFLAALPDSIRQEVLAQHEREQRRLRAQREGASLASTISPEFLAALPLNIQEEVECSVCKFFFFFYNFTYLHVIVQSQNPH